ASVDRAPERLFWGHVLNLALEDSGLRVGRVAGLGFRDPEIDELYDPLGAYQDVVRADVAMNDAQRLAARVFQLVRLVQPCTGVREDAQDDAGRDRHSLFLA